MLQPDRQKDADAYHALLARIRMSCGCAEADEETALPGELEIQGLWHAGLLGNSGETLRHGCVRILDFGEWNRSVGPDFLRAEIEIDGIRHHGDIEIDPTAQDWERHGHGANPDYTNVVLHIVLRRPPDGWYTRDAQHRDIPILPIAPIQLQQALGVSRPIPRESVGLCRAPLNDMPVTAIEKLLQAAAAYRAQNKRRTFCCKQEALGTDQAWFEAFAETLGYKINKLPMQMLARRAPLQRLKRHAEGILFGTAGFLYPMLPEQASPDARIYHRHVWDAWWPLREQFALEESRALPWRFAPLRPANHPQRRVAALALIATNWRHIQTRLTAEHAAELSKFLTGLQHPYWSTHCTLPSAELKKSVALIGPDRVKDFLVNHVYVQDEAPYAWQTYLAMRNRDIPQRVQLTAHHLFGERQDVRSLLPLMYVQQALLQIDADFCVRHSCSSCLFPEQLCQWH
ncbi:MAG: DUF2851 family protein [Akkermansia sp.]|nr:DUF2851 family protein [Akkermansia sp.]